MRRPLTFLAAAAAALCCCAAQGGCGSSGPAPGNTQVQVQNPGSALQCRFVLDMGAPVERQLTATMTVSCNFPVADSTTSLVIQGKPAGSPDTDWDNVDDPVPSSQIPPVSLTYKINCVAGYDYPASASIDALAENGAPVNATETTTPRSYSASECSGH
jgi:hypothetical protein